MKDALVAARKRAEEAVRDMSDGELKVKAFETILAHLLSGNGREGAAENGRPKVKAADTKTQGPRSLSDRILSLKDEGFFSPQRSIAEIRQELKKNGWHYPVTSLSGPLQALVQKKVLRRERSDDSEGRKGWKYSNW